MKFPWSEVAMIHKRNSTRTTIIIAFGAFALAYGFGERGASGFSTGPPAAHSGAPGELTCLGCHSTYPINIGSGVLTLTGLPANYSPNQELILTISLSMPGRLRYGVQATAVHESGKQAGTFIITDAARTQLQPGSINGNARVYLEHTQEGALANGFGRNEWTFKWRAPSTDVAGPGKVTFYIVGNAANGNGRPTGDYIYTKSFSTSPANDPGASVSNVSAASFIGSPLAPESIVAAFGSNLAVSTETASSLPLPATLAGTKVMVRDRTGEERLAPLFFVSPGQVNYQIPASTGDGTATITITNGNAITSMGSAQIVNVAPGLFAATANGQGWASAVALRVKPDGSQSFEPVVSYDRSQNGFVAVPLDLGPETDQVFLIAFGTGFRFRSALSAVRANLGGANAQVLFAGPQGDFVGLDQVNLRVPRELKGRGDVEIELEVDGQKANRVKIYIKK